MVVKVAEEKAVADAERGTSVLEKMRFCSR